MLVKAYLRIALERRLDLSYDVSVRIHIASVANGQVCAFVGMSLPLVFETLREL